MNGPLCSFGHVATTAELKATVTTRGELAALQSDPAVYRVRRGTYACTHLTLSERVAVRCHGQLDCLTALKELGVWVASGKDIHLRIRRGGVDAADKIRKSALRVVPHWQTEKLGRSLRVPVRDALVRAARCLSVDDLIATIESSVYLKQLTASEAAQLVESDLPRRLQRIGKNIDWHFRAQSGWETHMRLRFTRMGYRVEPQALIPGMGHLDNLIESVVALETDGRQHDLSVSEDRERDLRTMQWGIRVIRVDPRLIERDWPTVRATVERAVVEQLSLRTRNERAVNRQQSNTLGRCSQFRWSAPPPGVKRLWHESGFA